MLSSSITILIWIFIAATLFDIQAQDLNAKFLTFACLFKYFFSFDSNFVVFILFHSWGFIPSHMASIPLPLYVIRPNTTLTFLQSLKKVKTIKFLKILIFEKYA